jgi:N-glycosylase/DNA lyase
MKIRLSHSCPFNLDFTLCCGQAFRWDKKGEWWTGVVGNEVLKIRQKQDFLEFDNADVGFVKNYLGLRDDLPKILSLINKDKHIEHVIEECEGLRILRQDPWECLISYICATYKNIPAIKRMLFELSRKFGEKIVLEGCDFYTFPTPDRLARANFEKLSECGLGYRAKYVLETARKVHESNFDLRNLLKSDYEKVRCALLELPGVGLKVADCVSLFSLGKLEAFPVDVWVKRIILRYYANHFESEFAKKISPGRSPAGSEYERLSLFGQRYFGEFAGYAQEYLYHYERTRC